MKTELAECIRSGQATAEQIEAHYAAGEIAQPEQPALPTCYSDDAVAFIAKHLALRNYPANPHIAARAGWDAACDLLTKIAQPVQPASPNLVELHQIKTAQPEQPAIRNIADFPELQKAIREGLTNKTLHVQGAQPEQPATKRNFCETCGKRLSDSEYIHTCTPPESKA